MAFQIVDDILDFEGTESEIGKPVGNDLRQGTITLPSIMLIEKYPLNNPIKTLCEVGGIDSNTDKAINMIRNSTIIQESYDIARKHCEKARTSLSILPDSKYKKSLEDLSFYVMERSY